MYRLVYALRSLWAAFCLVSILLLICFSQVSTVAIDNNISGEPYIECLDDRISVKINTEKAFAGRIYAKGRADEAECVKGGYAAYQTRSPEFSLHLGKCGMKSLRSMNPRGMYYGITVVVSFHPQFLTKVDQAYHVKCFFEEAGKGVTAELGVSIHRSTISALDSGYGIGPPVQFARIGDKILHKWECMDPMFGIVVKNCYVTDGLGQRAEVIANNGCPIDPILISGIRYANNLTQAYAESHVFKFADRPGIWFFCQIQMCMKSHDLCNGVSPPQCNGNGGVNTYGTKAPGTTSYDQRFQKPIPIHSSQLAEENLLPVNSVRPSSTFGANKDEITLSYEAVDEHTEQRAEINVIFEDGDQSGIVYNGPTTLPQQVDRSDKLSEKPRVFEVTLGPRSTKFRKEAEPKPVKTKPASLEKNTISIERGQAYYNEDTLHAQLFDDDSFNVISNVPVNEDEISGQLIIFDLDEDPPSLMKMSKPAKLDGSLHNITSGGSKGVLSGIDGFVMDFDQAESTQNVVTETSQCIISTQGFIVVISALGSVSGLLSLIVVILCCRRRSSKLDNDPTIPGRMVRSVGATLMRGMQSRKRLPPHNNQHYRNHPYHH